MPQRAVICPHIVQTTLRPVQTFQRTDYLIKNSKHGDMALKSPIPRLPPPYPHSLLPAHSTNSLSLPRRPTEVRWVVQVVHGVGFLTVGHRSLQQQTMPVPPAQHHAHPESHHRRQQQKDEHDRDGNGGDV